MNYKLVVGGNQSNGNAGTKACDDAGKARMKTLSRKDYILLPMWNAYLPFSQSSKSSHVGFNPSGDDEKKVTEKPVKEGGDLSKDDESYDQEKEDNVNITNTVNAASTNEVNVVGAKTSIQLPDDPNMPELEDTIYSDNDEDVGAEANMNNLDAFMPVSHISTTRIHKDHPVEQIIGDLNSTPQTRRMTKNLEEHGYTQEEGIDYDEVFALVARIEAIWLFLAYASFKDFMVYQMDIKSAFLYGKIEEEVYVCQPPGFEDPDFPDRMSSMGELTFFLGQQVKQKNDEIFISKDKYVTEILKKFGFTDVKTASTPMETQKFLLKDEDGEEVDFHLYRSMIGSLMYLTSSRPDIMFALCACARYQVNPKISHLHAVKRIFRYLKGQPKLGLWYPKDSPFDFVAYTDSDYAGASLDRKSTTGGFAFLAKPAESERFEQIVDFLNAYIIKYALTVNTTIYTSCIEQFWATIKVKTVKGEVQLQALVDGKKIIVTEASVRRDLQLNDEEGTDCLPNATIFEKLTRMGAKTTAWNKFSSTMASAIICLATNQKFNFSKYIFESMVKNLDNAGKFLMYPSGPIDNVADEAVYEKRDDSLVRAATTATSLDVEQDMVKKLEKKGGSRTHKLKRLYKVDRSARIVSSDEASLGDQEDASKQGRKIDDIDKDAEITFIDET
ncbi:retrovirus-related pol polyprotein from transposon TNT 1-94 [Tanacetum coccineum]|uniref:Retrovirus-related pol polyprotein from transposon TNT 1-94 n=1 Tax=Tanacetum coccineum TaxID=301880 RepID=A0ABQ5FA55_9ASTR